MSGSQFSVKTTDEAAQAFESAYQAAKEQNPDLTKGAFFAEFVTMQTSQPSGDVIPSDFLELEESYNEAHELLLSISSALNVDREHILSEIQATQQRAMAVPDRVEVQKEIGANEMLVTVPEAVAGLFKTLLGETAKRLSEKYDTEITEGMILSDMFLRYTIERYNQWFYPFVIKPEEMKDLTGFDNNQLKKLWAKKG